jgi:hypothetical protein
MAKTIHGESQVTPEYRAWLSIKRRCYNENAIDYKYYGAKGVIVCERWLNSFPNFLEDMKRKPTPNHSLDRYPNRKGNYEPGNVRWATKIEQMRNMDRNTILTFQGKSMCITEWSEVTGLSAETIEDRLYNQNLSVEEVLTKPIPERYKRARV